MKDRVSAPQAERLTFKYDLDADPEKVWRAISLEDYREKWLPTDALATAEAVSTTPGQEVRYRLRDDEPPYLESVVTFRISPNTAGGTHLRIIHEIAGRRSDGAVKAANGNDPPLMRAA